MSSHASLRRMVRRARRMPGYRPLRRQVLGRLRQSETARDIVTRIFAGPDVGRRVSPRPYPPEGNLLHGEGTDQLPAVMISLVGIDGAAIDEVIDDVAREQLLTAAFRPVIVLDQPRMDAARRYGYAVELLIAEEEWDFPGQEWTEYAAHRLADIGRRFQVRAAATVTGEGIGEAQRVLLRSIESM